MFFLRLYYYFCPNICSDTSKAHRSTQANMQELVYNNTTYIKLKTSSRIQVRPHKFEVRGPGSNGKKKSQVEKFELDQQRHFWP